jgi:excisionase family DNA binding protein
LRKGGLAAPPAFEPVSPKPEPLSTAVSPTREAEDNNLLTITEAMAILNVSRQTVNNLMQEGKLTRIKIGRSVRLSRTDLERFIGR